MALTIADAEVRVTASGTGVVDDVVRDLDGGQGRAGASGQGLGRSIFGGIMAGWAAIGGISAVTGFFTGAITGASDLNETLSKTEAIFGANTSAVTTWASTSATTVGMSQAAALAAASSFGDMFTQIGFTGEAAASMSTQVVQAAADLGSFSNLDTADVTERISAAFRGEYDSLQAVIPNINAARVESEALAMTGKDTAASLTAQERAAAVLAIVQQDGARAMGDFARTSDGAANAARIASARFEDQQAALGQQLLPAWVGLLGFINDVALPGFSAVVDWIGKNGDTVLMLAGVLGGAVVAYGLVTGAMAVHAAFTAASAAASGGLTVAQWALNAAMSANPIGLIVTALALLVGAIVWVATQTTFFQDAWQWMVDAVGTAWQWLLDSVITPVSTAIGTALGWIQTNVLDPLVAGFTAAMTWISEAATNVATWIVGAVNTIAAIFTWLDANVVQPLALGFLVAFGIMAGIVTWLYENAVAPTFAAIGAVFTWLHDNVVAPVFAAIGAVFAWLQANVIAPFAAYVNASLNMIGSVFAWLHANVVVPVTNGIAAALAWVQGVIGAASGVIQGIIRGVGAVFSWLYANAVQPAVNGVASALQWVQGIVSSVTGWIRGAIDGVGNTVRTVFGAIGGFVGNAFQGALNAARGPINGLISLVNRAIRGINGLSVTIPSWVPVVGGQTWGVSLPTIPMLARGTNNAPDAFIAGENGPELITGARGSTVTPYSETRDRLADLGSRGGTTVKIEKVVLDASNVRDFMRIVELIERLPEVARAGRGQEGY